MNPWQNTKLWLTQFFNFSEAFKEQLFASIFIIVVFIALNRLILFFVFRRKEDVKAQYHWKKTSQYITYTILLFVLGRIWFTGFQSLATFLGLLSAGLAIALKEPVANMVGWGFILWRRPFEVGDRIQIGDLTGDVIDLRIFQFTLMEIGNWVDADQSTGRIIHINNGKVFSDYIANYSKGFQYIWHEIPVLLTFESDWKLGKKILEDIAAKDTEHLSKEAEEKVKKAARKYMIFFNKLTPIVYTTVKDCGVLLTIRYLCDPRNRRTTEQKIWENILDTFNEYASIDFAYPTTRYFNHITEGKESSEENRQ